MEKKSFKEKIKEKSLQAAGFVRKNWKELLILGGLAATAAVLSSRDSDGDKYSSDDNDDGETSRMDFSHRWLSKATDDELSSEREKARLRYVDAANIDEAGKLYNMLHDFDDEMITRSNAKYEAENPNAQPRQREHGWYLPNDD